MNKLLTKIVGVVLGATMAVGVGVGVAVNNNRNVVDSQVDAVEETISFTKVGASLGSNAGSGTTNVTATGTTDTYTFNYGNAKKQGDSAFLTKGSSGGTSFFSNKTAMPGDIKSLKVYINSGAAAATTYHCAFNTTECTSRYVTGSTAVNITGGNSNTYTCSVNGAKYFCIALGNNNNGQVLGFDVTYESTSSASLVSITDVNATVSAQAGDDDWTITNASATGNLSTGNGVDVTNYVDISVDEDVPDASGDTNVTLRASKKSSVSGTVSDFTKTITVNVSEPPAYLTGFESGEGFTASTSYKHSDEVEFGPNNQKWGIVYGSVTDTASKIISGSQSLILRYYSDNTGGGTPRGYMNFDVTDGHEIKFNAKASTSSTFDLCYSTDSGSNWTTLLDDETVDSTGDSYSASIPSYTSKARFKFEWNCTTDSSDVRFDDIEIYSMAKPTDPVVTITSKDGSGFMSGALGDTQEVTYEKDNDTGLTLSWTLIDSDSIVEWDDELLAVSFEDVGDDATLTASLKDGNNVVKASDTVTLKTLAPTATIKYNGQDRSKLTVFVGDEDTITVDVANMPIGLNGTVEWSTNDPNEDKMAFLDGAFEAVAAGKVVATVAVKYKGTTYATDSLEFTINDLGEPTLVVSTGEGKTTYKFGEELDTTGWTATYTDARGASTSVIDSLDFGELNYIGTKALTATYQNVESNGVNITVTNNEAAPTSGVVSKELDSSSSSTNMTVDSEIIKVVDPAVASVVTAKIDFTAVITGANQTDEYTHGITLSIYDGSDQLIGSQEVTDTKKNGGTISCSYTFNLSSNPKTVAKASYNLTTKAASSNVRFRTFSVTLTYGDPTYAENQAKAWAQYFIDEVGGLCDAGGNTSAANIQAIKDKWTTLGNEYGWMTNDSKDYFVAHITDNAKFAQVIGMYEKIVSRYEQANFIEDSNGNKAVEPTNASTLGGVASNTTLTATVIIVSAIVMTTLCGYFLLRKRKEER